MRKRRTEASRKAETELIGLVSLADRLDTELVVVRYAERLARGRLHRAVELLWGLVRGDFGSAREAADLQRLTSALTLVGAQELLELLRALDAEFARLAVRADELRDRLARVTQLAQERLTECLQLLPGRS
ncbi:MAG: hypothetical protein QM817_17680 [Archangium sp.]